MDILKFINFYQEMKDYLSNSQLAISAKFSKDEPVSQNKKISGQSVILFCVS